MTYAEADGKLDSNLILAYYVLFCMYSKTRIYKNQKIKNP